MKISFDILDRALELELNAMIYAVIIAAGAGTASIWIGLNDPVGLACVGVSVGALGHIRHCLWKVARSPA